MGTRRHTGEGGNRPARTSIRKLAVCRHAARSERSVREALDLLAAPTSDLVADWDDVMRRVRDTVPGSIEVTRTTPPRRTRGQRTRGADGWGWGWGSHPFGREDGDRAPALAGDALGWGTRGL